MVTARTEAMFVIYSLYSVHYANFVVKMAIDVYFFSSAKTSPSLAHEFFAGKVVRTAQITPQTSAPSDPMVFFASVLR